MVNRSDPKRAFNNFWCFADALIFIVSLLPVSCVNVTTFSPLESSSEKPFALPIECEECPPYELVWYDEFSDDNLTRWQAEIGCGGSQKTELQCYTPHGNGYILNGFLHLEARVERWNDTENTLNLPFTSAKYHSHGDGWLYGMFEFRVRMPKGKLLRPIISLVPANYLYGTWPRSGEIYVAEARGENSNYFQSSIRFGSPSDFGRERMIKKVDPKNDLSESHHIYSLEWTKSSLAFFLDGHLFWHVDLNRKFNLLDGPHVYNKTGMPFDQPFKILAYLPVGGAYFLSDQSEAGVRPWKRSFLQIDWVRVYQRPGIYEKATTSLSTTLSLCATIIAPVSLILFSAFLSSLNFHHSLQFN